MELIGIKSRIIKPNEDLENAIWQMLKRNKIHIKDGDILVITSKIVSVCQGRVVPVADERELEALVKKEADIYFGGNIALTLKEHVLIPRAGIDQSNVEQGYAVLWPNDSWSVAKKIRNAVIKKFGVKNFGVLIVDSHCQPLRWGVTGIALAYSGFVGLEDMRGHKDLFGRKLSVTRKAVGDQLASAALMLMGESDEAVPMVVIRNAPVKYTARAQKQNDFFVNPNQCLFAAIYKNSFLKKVK